MIRPNLLAWQWSDYAAKHRDRGNLALHLVAVPLFWAGTAGVVSGLSTGRWTLAAGGVGAWVASLVLQGRGHAREAERPTPFTGPADFVSRFVAEQFVTFPRFVVSLWRQHGG